jgi:hypothetical protein
MITGFPNLLDSVAIQLMLASSYNQRIFTGLEVDFRRSMSPQEMTGAQIVRFTNVTF